MGLFDEDEAAAVQIQEAKRNIELYPFQITSHNKVMQGFKTWQRQLLVLPTGGGKTVVSGSLIQHTYPRKSLFIAHTNELVDQAYKKIYAFTGIKPDIEKAEKWAHIDSPIVVASRDSLQRDRLERFPRDHFALVIADEAHISLSATYQNILTRFDQFAKILGITATPDRGDKKSLGIYYQNLAHQILITELIQQGFLAPIVIKTIPIDIDLSGVHVDKKSGDLDENETAKTIHPYLQEIARAIKIHTPGRKTIAFLPLVSTSVAFTAACKAEGINAVHVHGSHKEREKIVREYQDGKYQLISNSQLLVTGFDDPPTDCIVNLKPTRSRAMYSQAIGRGTRIFPGKKNLLILDFLWNHDKHNLCRPASLIAPDEEIANEMTRLSEDAARGRFSKGQKPEMNLSELQTLAIHEREKTLLDELKKSKGKSSKTISLVEFAASTHDIDLHSYQAAFDWQKEGVTEKQAELISQFGIDQKDIKDKGHAKLVIGKIMERRDKGLASPKQVVVCRSMGHASPENLTRAEASDYIDMRKSQMRKA